MLCCILPLKLDVTANNIVAKAYLHGPFLVLFFSLGGRGVVLCYCQAHFLGHLSSALCLSLQVSPPCSCLPTPFQMLGLKTPHFSLAGAAFPLLSTCQPWDACVPGPVQPTLALVLSIMPECRSREAFFLWCLSASSLRSMNTCGLYYQILISIRMSLVNDDSWFQTLHSIICFLPATAALCTLFSLCL